MYCVLAYGELNLGSSTKIILKKGFIHLVESAYFSILLHVNSKMIILRYQS